MKQAAMYAKTALCGTCAALLLAMPSHAQSQSNPVPAQPASSPSASAPGLEDIVVTARRTNENMQKVPIAVTAFTQDAIRKQNIVAPEDLMNKVPSLSVTSAGDDRDSLRIAIRGQGQQENGAAPAVVAYFAEVPAQLTGPGSLFDLQNLQVLKGPQGTLFGRNSTGGAILVVPQRPKDTFGGYLEGSLGSDALRRFQGALNVPIVDDKLSIRLATDIQRRRGFTKDLISGLDMDDVHYESYRIGILFKPSDRFENYTVADYFRSDTNGPGTKMFSLDPNGLAATTFPEILALYNKHLPYSETEIYTGGKPYDNVRNYGVSNSTTFHLSDDVYLKNIFGYRVYKQRYSADIIGVPVPLIAFIPSPYESGGSASSPVQSALSEEFQLGGTSFADKLKWIIGAYGENDKPTSDQNKDVLAQFGTSPFVIQSLDTDRTRALFAQGTYDLSGLIDHLKFTAGIRHTWDTRKQLARNYLASSSDLDTPVVCQLPLGDATCAVHNSAKFAATTGTVGLDYQITPHTLLYIASRRGYKSGGFNSSTPVTSLNSFQPEYVTDVEIGAKTDFTISGIKARINADVYRQYYDKIQQARGVFINNQLMTVTQNSGSAILQGFEFEYTLLFNRYFELSGYYDYLDAYYTNNIDNGVDLSHIPLAQAPKNKVAVTATYNFAQLPENVGKLSASINYAYQSRIEFQVPELPVDPDPNHGQKGYGLINLRADWDNVMNSPFDVSFFMTNATDKRYKLSGTLVYPSLGIDGGLVGEPREFGFELRYHFGGG